MADVRIDRLGKLMVEYSVDVQPGQVIEISGGPIASPLMQAAYKYTLLRGGHPVVRAILPGITELMFQHGNDEQLQYLALPERWGMEEADGLIRMMSETNTRSLTGVDPARQRLAQKARGEVRQAMMNRAATGDLAWVLTLFPTEAYAQDAEMSLAEYEEFVYGAGLLDDPDPVARWKEISVEQQRLCDWLSTRNEIHVRSEGTDLTVQTGGRTWINADGKHNFPDGEIFTGPIENSANGHVSFTFPSTMNGRSVEGITLEFKDGKVVNASADKNEEYLISTLDTDEGARYLGEFAFGTNKGIQEFTGNTLFDEKIGGTLHMAVGAGYPQSGSSNKSAVHWDMILDLRNGSEVH
ncbi:MAG: aminopeptidase, partial [Thermomicrobiaceae bacterium]